MNFKNIHLVFLLLLSFQSVFSQKEGYWDKERATTKEIIVSARDRIVVKTDDLPKGTTEVVFRITLLDENQQMAGSLVSVLKSIPDPTGISQGSAGAVFKNQGVNHSSNDESTLFLGRVPDDDLFLLYAGALVFAYPSLYEGFGFPILEAMASGVPVLSSNVTSMPEVAGEAAYLVNPYSVDEIAQGLSNLLSSPDLRAQYIQKGFTQLELFSRDKVMKKFKTAFESVV